MKRWRKSQNGRGSFAFYILQLQASSGVSALGMTQVSSSDFLSDSRPFVLILLRPNLLPQSLKAIVDPLVASFIPVTNAFFVLAVVISFCQLPICADHIIFIGVFGSPETHFIKL
jgi:hypothetical protein